MYTTVPAISGKQFIDLLIRDGWEIKGRSRHGIALAKSVNNRVKVVPVPNTTRSLPKGTLRGLLSVKQTGIGRQGLLRLLNKDSSI